MIRNEAESLGDSLNPDEEYDPERDLTHGPTAFKDATAAHDERVIDQLLASAPRSGGYYLKLYREVGPGQYEYKMRLNDYAQWSDLEFEIANIVVYMTKRAPQKWGSGVYKVVIWNEKGMRGETYPPFLFTIDAMDPEQATQVGQPPPIDTHAVVNEQIGTFANMVNAMKGFIPAPINPADTNKQLADSFAMGMNATGTRNNEGNQSNMMMMTMMMGMMKEFAAALRPTQQINPVPTSTPTEELAKTLAVMKTFGALPDQQQKGDLVSTLRDLGTLGFQPFKANDPLEQVGQMKQIFGMFKDFMGGVAGEAPERPDMMEKVIDVLGPQVSKILSDIVQLSNNYTRMNAPGAPQVAQSSTPANRIDRSAPTPDYVQPFHERPDYPEREDVMGNIGGGRPGGPLNPTEASPNVPIQPQKSENDMFLDDLYQNMIISNTGFYERFYDMIKSIPQGKELLNGLISGQVTVDAVIGMIHNWGGQRFIVPEVQENLRSYVVGFLAWIQDHKAPPQISEHNTQQDLFEFQTEEPVGDQVVGKCQRCGEEWLFENEAGLQTAGPCEEKILVENGETRICGGAIEIIQVLTQGGKNESNSNS
jgi:hypothetical protein